MRVFETILSKLSRELEKACDSLEIAGKGLQNVVTTLNRLHKILVIYPRIH